MLPVICTETKIDYMIKVSENKRKATHLSFVATLVSFGPAMIRKRKSSNISEVANITFASWTALTKIMINSINTAKLIGVAVEFIAFTATCITCVEAKYSISKVCVFSPLAAEKVLTKS